MAKRILKNIRKNGDEYEVGNIKTYTITEDITTVTAEATAGVSPYDTSYGYTNITINENSGIKWKEGAVYSFVVNTEMVVDSSKRNVRVRIGNSGSWIPVMDGAGTILNGNEFMKKSGVLLFVYKTTYQSTGALHIMYSIPTGGNEGQVLTRTSAGLDWCDAGGGGGGGYLLDYLLIGGGGGGGSGIVCGISGAPRSGGAGGGGGEVICIRSMTVLTSFPVVIGAGGNGGNAYGAPGCNGGNSYFNGTIAIRGEGGCCGLYAQDGGGGGGASGSRFLGGMGLCYGERNGGGGGGAGGHGCPAGRGGQAPYYSAGGPGLYGYGGGGNGSYTYGVAGVDGGGASNGGNATNCGGGGGGGKAETSTGGKGAGGLLKIQYPSDGSYGFSCATGGTVSTCIIDGVEYKIHCFTSNGTFTIVS